MPHATTISPEVKQCAELCQECYAACSELVGHCLELGGPHAAAEHIGLLLDCAKICMVAGDFMVRGSHRHGQVCGVCAEICAECAEDCDRLGATDEDMQKCADLCRHCADSCRKMGGVR